MRRYNCDFCIENTLGKIFHTIGKNSEVKICEDCLAKTENDTILAKATALSEEERTKLAGWLDRRRADPPKSELEMTHLFGHKIGERKQAQ